MSGTELIAWLTFIVLLLTLGVLIWYTIETRRIANQTVQSNLRPVILYIGWIKDWNFELRQNTFRLPSIQLQNQKNIATDIKGYVVVANKKYQLLFANPITEIVDDEKKITHYLPMWKFLPAMGVLSIAYENDKSESFVGKNKIVIEYTDIEGGKYFTEINDVFSVTTRRI